MDEGAPQRIRDLLGRNVRVTGPGGSWEGFLVSYARDPSVILEQHDGTKVCLPASFEIAEPRPCPQCDGTGRVP